jgi:hypothetical protein
MTITPKNMNPKDLDLDAKYNPSSGMLVRNPSHEDIATRADDQRAIVAAIRETKANWQKAVYDYSDLSRIPGLPGMLKIRDLDEKNMLGFCLTLMRAKPNITGITLKLGDYPTAQDVRGSKIANLHSRQPRNPSEIAKDLAVLLSSGNIVEFNYKINNAAPGDFDAVASAKVVTDDIYRDDSLFKPYLEIEYFNL